MPSRHGRALDAIHVGESVSLGAALERSRRRWAASSGDILRRHCRGLGAFLLARENAGLPALVIHSVPIWFMAEMGLVGLVAYAFFVASLLAVDLSGLRRDAPYARGLLVAVAVYVVMSLVHDLFFQRAFWFLAGLLLVKVGTPARSAEPAREPASSRGML